MDNIDPNWAGSGEEIYRENILEHYRRPHNFGKLEKFSFKGNDSNPLCGDNFEIFVSVKKERVDDVKFSGGGCAISTAAISMLTDRIVGMKEEELRKISEEDVLKMIGVSLDVVRRKCGLLCLKVLNKGLEGENE